jgi:cytochrome P450
MRSCLYFILQNPSVYQRLQKEIDDYYVSANLQQPISFQQTQELPYLKSVIAEATRLYPSIVYQLLRHVPDGGMEVNGHFLPAGTPVGMSPIAANRDKAIWGEDADVFLPERWLENPERSTYLESYNMTYGGHGSRACIGRNLALVSTD